MKIETVARACETYKEYEDVTFLRNKMEADMVYFAKEKMRCLKEQNLDGFLHSFAGEQWAYMGLLYCNGQFAGQSMIDIIDSIQDIMMIGDGESIFGEHFMDSLMESFLKEEITDYRGGCKSFFKKINNTNPEQLCTANESTLNWNELIPYFLKILTALLPTRKK